MTSLLILLIIYLFVAAPMGLFIHEAAHARAAQAATKSTEPICLVIGYPALFRLPDWLLCRVALKPERVIGRWGPLPLGGRTFHNHIANTKTLEMVYRAGPEASRSLTFSTLRIAVFVLPLCWFLAGEVAVGLSLEFYPALLPLLVAASGLSGWANVFPIAPGKHKLMRLLIPEGSDGYNARALSVRDPTWVDLSQPCASQRHFRAKKRS